jgi:hypothetical protein
MSKTMKKYEIGMAVANASEGRIKLTIEDSVATLRGEFTRKDRKPIKYKTGGWRYHFEDGAEFWTLNVSRIIGQIEKSANEPKVEPKAKSSAEPKPESAAKPSRKSGKKPSKPKGAVKAGSFYVRWDGERPESFKVVRSTKSSIWLVGADGKEFRKSIGESPAQLSGGFYKVG